MKNDRNGKSSNIFGILFLVFTVLACIAAKIIPRLDQLTETYNEYKNSTASENLERFLFIAIIVAAVLLIVYISKIIEKRKFSKMTEKLNSDESLYNDSDTSKAKTTAFVTKHGKNIKSDILYRYRSSMTLIPSIVGVFCLFCLFIPGLPNKLLWAITALSLFAWVGYRCYAAPARFFLKHIAPLINDDYMNGKLAVYNSNGINIGNSFLVIYNNAGVMAYPMSDVKSISRKVRLHKEKNRGLFGSEKYEYLLCLIISNQSSRQNSADMNAEVRLSKNQLEAVFEELKSRGVTYSLDYLTEEKD